VRAEHEVADVLHRHWMGVEQSPHINGWQLRTLSAIKRCRTAALGGHEDACTDCGVVRNSYNSCRNRHCPKCQGNEREKWIQKREEELLPVPYFHVVFTLPDKLNQLAMHQPKHVYDALFESAWATMKTFGNDATHLGANTGMISILHTWGQTMTLHPHLHCIVPGGGLTTDQQWKTAKSKGKFLFPVKAMSPVFRGKYLDALKARNIILTKEQQDAMYKNNWVVYAKRAFGNAQSVIEYLGRYTHKIAISNHRIKSIDESSVTFSYKDYRKGAQKLEMKLDAMEFVQRFSLHILPKGFMRIRHFGILSSTSKRMSIPCIKSQVTVKGNLLLTKSYKVHDYNPKMCKHCKTETMVTIKIFTSRGPPSKIKVEEIRIEKK